MSGRLQDGVALATGAGVGMRSAIAQLIAQEGAAAVAAPMPFE